MESLFLLLIWKKFHREEFILLFSENIFSVKMTSKQYNNIYREKVGL